jgi:SAM-dependent methyltransferase
MSAAYDTIGTRYSAQRLPDPAIAAMIHAALGDAQSVVNVGAGTGSYEPQDRAVTAVEPSADMIRQRPANAAPAVQGEAEALPFADASFDAAMAILTVHHWENKARGMAELKRVSRGRIVILTHDPDFRGAWLMDYFPELVSLDAGQMPPLSAYEGWLGPVSIQPVPVLHECRDGFLYAFWRRPHAYLDPDVRSGMSSFWKIGGVADGLARLAADLQSGAWDTRYRHLMAQESADMGYRLVTTVSNPPS